MIKWFLLIILTWFANCFVTDNRIDNQVLTFTTTDTNCHVVIVTLSTQGNAKLLQQFKSGFLKKINWNKYQSKVTKQEKTRCLDYLIDPDFQGVNRLFVLPFENNIDRGSYKRYYLLKVEIKDNNVMIDGRNVFDQLVKFKLRKDPKIFKHSKDCNWSRRWLQNWLYTGLFQKLL